MPCMCWYDPPEGSKKIIKDSCVTIVKEIKEISKDGDPIGYDLRNVKELLDHLMYPEICKEKERKT